MECDIVVSSSVSFTDSFVPSKWRICAYFPDDEVVKILERRAMEENRSLSNLAATILMKAAKEYEQQQMEESPETPRKRQED